MRTFRFEPIELDLTVTFKDNAEITIPLVFSSFEFNREKQYDAFK